MVCTSPSPSAELQILRVPSVVWCSESQTLLAHQCQSKKLGAQPVRKPRDYPDSTWAKLTTTNTHHPLWQGIASGRANSSAREVTTLGKRESLGWKGPGVNPVRDAWAEILGSNTMEERSSQGCWLQAEQKTQRQSDPLKQNRSGHSTLLPRCPCVMTGWKPLPCEPLLYEFHWEFEARWNEQGTRKPGHDSWSQTGLGLYPVTVGFLTGSAWLS